MRKAPAGVVLLLVTIVIIAVGCPDKSASVGAAEGAPVVKQDGEGCCIMIRKYQDMNANGLLDAEDPEIEWPVYWEDPTNAIFNDTAPQWCINAGAPGLWNVWEGSVEGWFLTGVMVNWEFVDNFMDPIPIEVPEVCEGYFEVIFLNAQGETPPQPPNGECDLVILKVNDLNGNGLWDMGEPEIADWPVSYTDPLGMQFEDLTPVCINDPALGVWTVSEGWMENWLATGALVNGVPVENCTEPIQVEFTGDEQFQIVFLNMTCPPPEGGRICAFKGYDPDGDGPANDLPLEGWRICLSRCECNGVLPVNGDLIEPLCAYTGCDGFVCWDNLEPGCYKVCEVTPCGDWVSTTPECFEVELAAGGYQEVRFSNYCFTTVEMHTKGWWQNSHGCAAIEADPTLLDALNALAPFMSGTIYTRGMDNCTGERCQNVVLPFDSASELGCYIVAPNSQNGRLGLAQQLAAFTLNCLNETGSLDLYFCELDMTAEEIVEEAVEAWECGYGVKYWQCLLDLLNNTEEIETISPEPCKIDYSCNGDEGEGDGEIPG